MSEMVERVARAIIRSQVAEYIASDAEWRRVVAWYREMCAEHPNYAASRGLITDAFRTASIAIEAMQEPTHGMLRAGDTAQSDTSGDVWRAMHAAALAPEP